MCWLYSVPNLLVISAIRHSVFRWELCKGCVCESVKKTQDVCIQRSLTTGSCDWQVAKVAHVWSMQGTEGSRQLENYRTKSIVWPGSYLTTQTRDLFQPWDRVTRMLCFAENWLFTFLTYPTINTLIPNKFREFPERILREKP